MTPCGNHADGDDDDGYQWVSMETVESLHFHPLHIPDSCMYMCYHLLPTLQAGSGANMHLTSGAEDGDSIRRKLDESVLKERCVP